MIVVVRSRDGHQGQPRAARAEREGVDWITALKAPQIKKLVRDGRAAAVAVRRAQPGRDHAPRTIPGERLIVCRNPLVAAERARKRDDLLPATERGARRDRAARRRAARCTGADQIGLAVGPALEALQGQQALPDRDHRHQLHLRAQDRADRRRGGARRHLRPAHQRHRDTTPDRRRRARLQAASNRSSAPSAPSKAPSSRSARSTTASKTASARTSSSACSPTTSPGTCARPGRRCSSTTSSHPPSPDPVAKATRSPHAAAARPQTKRTSTGEPCHSYHSLLAELATLTRNTIRLHDSGATFDKLTQPTPTQARALELIDSYPLTT